MWTSSVFPQQASCSWLTERRHPLPDTRKGAVVAAVVASSAEYLPVPASQQANHVARQRYSAQWPGPLWRRLPQACMKNADSCPAHLRRQLGKLLAYNRKTGAPGGHHKASRWSDGLLQHLQTGGSSISAHHHAKEASIHWQRFFRTCCPGRRQQHLGTEGLSQNRSPEMTIRHIMHRHAASKVLCCIATAAA